MFCKVKYIIQKLKCRLPFNLNHFWHKNIYVVKKLSDQSELIKCRDCGKMFAMNHSVRIILPWESVRFHYEELDHLTRQ
jgi:hypothetical protein